MAFRSREPVVAVETLQPLRAYTREQLNSALLVAYALHERGITGRFIYCLPPED